MAWGRKVGMKRARVLDKGLELLGVGCGNVPVIWRSLRRPISPLAGEMPDRAEGGLIRIRCLRFHRKQLPVTDPLPNSVRRKTGGEW